MKLVSLRSLFAGALLLLSFLFVSRGTGTPATVGVEAAQAGRIVRDYQEARNAGNAKALAQLFEESGVAMVQGAPTKTGALSVRAFYETLFTNLGFALEFEVAELEAISSDWAFARTNSSGTVLLRDSDKRVPSGGHELFLLHKDPSGSWKIARYAASSVR